MVFDPWGRAAGCRIPYAKRQRVPAFPHWERRRGAFCSVVSCSPRRRGERYTSILQETRYEQYLKKTYDRSELDSKTGPSGPCISGRALLRTIIPSPSFHLAPHPRSCLVPPCSIYPPNARRTVQSVIIRRNTSKIVDSFSS